jgi:hypothetical protein
MCYLLVGILLLHSYCLFVCLMVFNATFNNISVISRRSVLLVEETTSHCQTLSHNVVHLALIEIRTRNMYLLKQYTKTIYLVYR